MYICISNVRLQSNRLAHVAHNQFDIIANKYVGYCWINMVCGWNKQSQFFSG